MIVKVTAQGPSEKAYNINKKTVYFLMPRPTFHAMNKCNNFF